MNNLSIIVKTFGRPKSLIVFLKSVLKKYPNIKILVGDDSKNPNFSNMKKIFSGTNISFYKLPYDCGLSYGRNFLLDKVKTKYFCLCDDDFVFDKQTDLEYALNLLKKKELDIIGGYIRNYKIVKNLFDKIIVIGQKVFKYELPSNYLGSINRTGNTLNLNYIIHQYPDYCDTDIVLNFFVANTKIIREKNRWDNRLKLQEHTPFFYNAKKNGLRIGFTNRLSTQHHPVQTKQYQKYRQRNYTEIFMKNEGITKICSTYDDPKRNKIIEQNFNNSPLISIVIPVFNAKEKVKELYESLKNQIYDKLEIIFVDNNSKDDTLSILKEIKKVDKRVKIYTESKQGPNHARYKGYKKSHGEYIYFCDSDDYLEYDAMSNFIKIIDETHADIVIGNYNEVNANNEIIRKMKGINFELTNGDKNKFLLVKPALWNKIFRKELITDNSFHYSFMGEDMIITILALIKAVKIEYIDKTIYNYKLDDNGLSSSVNQKAFIGEIDSCNALRKKIVELKEYENYKQEIDYLLISHGIYRLLRANLLKNKEEKKTIYSMYKEFFKTVDFKNKYYKNSLFMQLAYCLEKNWKVYNSFLSKFIVKMIFKNKMFNKIIKRLDK